MEERQRKSLYLLNLFRGIYLCYRSDDGDDAKGKKGKGDKKNKSKDAAAGNDKKGGGKCILL